MSKYFSKICKVCFIELHTVCPTLLCLFVLCSFFLLGLILNFAVSSSSSFINPSFTFKACMLNDFHLLHRAAVHVFSLCKAQQTCFIFVLTNPNHWELCNTQTPPLSNPPPHILSLCMSQVKSSAL